MTKTKFIISKIGILAKLTVAIFRDSMLSYIYQVSFSGIYGGGNSGKHRKQIGAGALAIAD